MPVSATGTKQVSVSVEGERHPHLLQFVGNGLYRGQGRFECHSHVAVVNTNGDVTETAIPEQHVHEFLLSAEILNHDFRDGMGGTVKGAQVVAALSDACEMMWTGKINPDGTINPEEQAQ